MTAPGTGVAGDRAGAGGLAARCGGAMWRSVAAIARRAGYSPRLRWRPLACKPSCDGPGNTVSCMAKIHSSTLPNGLPLYRVDLPGTRAVTVLVAFDAGARTERPEENGMAHFLEHLVFKGGEKYDDYRKVNETAERMGAVLNAYTSHDLVAFHITCRAEVVGEAIDLLTDFVGRPKIDAEELDRERGVVIQEIARANDQPSVARRAPDRPRGVRRPPARAARARARGAPAHVHPRRDRRLPRAPVGGRARRRVPRRQPRRTCPRTRSWSRRSGASRRSRPTARYEPAPAVHAARRSSRSATPTSRTCGCPTGRRSTPRDAAAARRARGLLDAARRLDGLAPVRRDPRAARPRLLRLLGRPRVRRRADPAALGRAGVRQVRRGLHAHARDRRRAAHRRARREEEVERARAYAAGRRVLAFENTNAVARHAATQTVVYGAGDRPRRGDRARSTR